MLKQLRKELTIAETRTSNMLTKCIKGLTQHLLGFPKLSRDVPSTILCSSMGDVYIGINTGGGEISVATNLTPQAVKILG